MEKVRSSEDVRAQMERKAEAGIKRSSRNLEVQSAS